LLEYHIQDTQAHVILGNIDYTSLAFRQRILFTIEAENLTGKTRRKRSKIRIESAMRDIHKCCTARFI
jgi:hypothetical protein